MRSHVPIGAGIRAGLTRGIVVAYRCTRIGYLYEGDDGYLRYVKVRDEPTSKWDQPCKLKLYKPLNYAVQ